jgi:hypothetical protein
MADTVMLNLLTIRTTGRSKRQTGVAMKSVLHREAEATYRPHLHESKEPALSRKSSTRIGIILIVWGGMLLGLGSGLPAVIISIIGCIVILDGYLMVYLKEPRKTKLSPRKKPSLPGT